MQQFLFLMVYCYLILHGVLFLLYVYRCEICAMVMRVLIIHGKVGWIRYFYSWSNSNNNIKRMFYDFCYNFYRKNIGYSRFSLQRYELVLIDKIYRNSGLVPIKIIEEGIVGYEYYRPCRFVCYALHDIIQPK